MNRTNRERLLAFFAAENARDWQTYRSFLSPDVVWTLYAKDVRRISGIDAYLDAMMAAYQGSEDTFTVQSLYADGEENRIVAILVNNHGETSCDIFGFQDGLIRREFEFLL